MSLLNQFRLKYGMHTHDSCLPSQSYCESFEEKLAEGQLTAETLAQVTSLAEEERQRAQKPEPARQLGLHLDATPTIPPRRHFVSSAPTSTDEVCYYEQHGGTCTNAPTRPDVERIVVRAPIDPQLPAGT